MMTNISLKLTLLSGRFAICKFTPDSSLPDWVMNSPVFSISRTFDELSIMCEEQYIPVEIERESGWRAFKFEGPFDFQQVGILNAVTAPLAQAKIGIFAISTYDTDYVLIKELHLNKTISALSDYGHKIEGIV